MKNRPDVSIIIVNHNAEKFFRKTLDSIKLQKGVTTETIVIDNNSTDNSRSVVKREYPWVTVIARTSDFGFSAGNNVGVQRAKAETVLFLNPDCAFTKSDDLKRCYDKYYALKNVGILTARVNLVINGRIDVTCHRGFPTPWAGFTHFSGLEYLFPKSKLFSQYTAGYLGYDTEHEVEAVGGMFMLMARRIGERIGWWDEEYPLYGEDLDLSYRVHELGLRNYYWPDVVVNHYKGATTGMSASSKNITTASRETTRRVKGWSIQAMEIFYRKHYIKKYPFYINGIVILGIRIMKMLRVTLG